MEICGQTFSDEIIDRIRGTITTEVGLSRVKLSRQVCEWLNWRGSAGRFKEVSSRVALLKLERRGLIKLPPAGKIPGRRGEESARKTRAENIPRIECRLPELGGIELVKIGNKGSRKSQIWNELMKGHHYLGAGPLCGAQMRYLIRSEHQGWLGGLAFSAAAWSLEARDKWIGWKAEERCRHLEKVVCNSRFLILPQVKVKYLASHVLSLSVKRLSKDWLERYGYEPVLLETFVEQDRFRGTSYRAANWIKVGKTQGRGRQDRKCEKGVAVKDIYVYPLQANAQELLCEGRKRAEARQKSPKEWTEEELGETKFGDERLEKRLLLIARDFYARPQANIPQACQSRAKTKAAYRFLEHEKVKMEKILESHRKATIRRMEKKKVVLAVQDTTTLNYSAHPETEGLGLIGYSKNGGTGLIVHDTMAFDESGTPLGLLDVQCWARDPEDFGKKHLRKKLPIKEKESYKWLKSFNQAAKAQQQCPETKIVSVGDREADIFELFQLALKDGEGPKLLVRAEHDRLLAEGQKKLWDTVAQQTVSGTHKIWVSRKGKQPAREAELEVRFAEVKLKSPRDKKKMEELTIFAVLGKETAAVGTDKCLEWMLLSTDPVRTFEEAREKLEWYSLRWGIEIYHRTLKSGCKIKERQLRSADRIEACLAIDMIVAWRIFHLTKLGREIPDALCTVFFEEVEWKALVTYIKQDPTHLKETPHLREAVRMVSSLGGFLGRKGDGEPGTKSLWLGLQRLDDIAASWKIMAVKFAPELLVPSVSRTRYG